MSVEERKAIVRWGLEELWNEGNLDVIDEALAADAIVHDVLSGDVHGPEGLRRLMAAWRAAFPDLQIEIHDQIGQGDLVVTRYTASGTHQGVLGPRAPTGRRVAAAGVSIARFADGKIVEVWETWDALAVVRELRLPRCWRGAVHYSGGNHDPGRERAGR
jgi:steroid delta-isomerase-like uncharacterized protein